MRRRDHRTSRNPLFMRHRGKTPGFAALLNHPNDRVFPANEYATRARSNFYYDCIWIIIRHWVKQSFARNRERPRERFMNFHVFSPERFPGPVILGNFPRAPRDDSRPVCGKTKRAIFAVHNERPACGFFVFWRRCFGFCFRLWMGRFDDVPGWMVNHYFAVVVVYFGKQQWFARYLKFEWDEGNYSVLSEGGLLICSGDDKSWEGLCRWIEMS